MTTNRKPAKKPGVLAGRLSLVSIERGGVTIQVGDVPASQAVAVAVTILRALQAHEREFPALQPNTEVVQIGGYSPLAVTDDEVEARRVGFG